MTRFTNDFGIIVTVILVRFVSKLEADLRPGGILDSNPKMFSIFFNIHVQQYSLTFSLHVCKCYNYLLFFFLVKYFYRNQRIFCSAHKQRCHNLTDQLIQCIR